MFFTVHVSNNRVPLLEPRLNVYNAIISKQTTSWKVGCETFTLVVSKIKTWIPLNFLVHISREWTLKVLHEQINQFESGEKLRANPFPVCLSVDNRSRQVRPKLTLSARIFFFCIRTHFQSKHLLFVRTNRGHQMLLFPYLNAL